MLATTIVNYVSAAIRGRIYSWEPNRVIDEVETILRTGKVRKVVPAPVPAGPSVTIDGMTAKDFCRTQGAV